MGSRHVHMLELWRNNAVLPEACIRSISFFAVSGDGVQETWVPCTGLKVKRNIAPDPFMDDDPCDLSLRRGVSSVARSDNFCLHSMLTESAASLKWRRKAVWIDLLPCSNQALGAQVFGGEVYKPGRHRICQKKRRFFKIREDTGKLREIMGKLRANYG